MIRLATDEEFTSLISLAANQGDTQIVGQKGRLFLRLVPDTVAHFVWTDEDGKDWWVGVGYNRHDTNWVAVAGAIQKHGKVICEELDEWVAREHPATHSM